MALTLDSKIPSRPLAEKGTKHKFDLKLVNPSNRRKFDVIVVGSGIAGTAEPPWLVEPGYTVMAFPSHTPPRRRASLAAQGGQNTPKD